MPKYVHDPELRKRRRHPGEQVHAADRLDQSPRRDAPTVVLVDPWIPDAPAPQLTTRSFQLGMVRGGIDVWGPRHVECTADRRVHRVKWFEDDAIVGPVVDELREPRGAAAAASGHEERRVSMRMEVDIREPG